MPSAALWLTFALAAVSACSSSPAADAAPTFDAPPSTEMGSIDDNHFVAWEDGHESHIVIGFQGKHVWVALRMKNLNVNTVDVAIEGRYTDDDAVFCGYRFAPDMFVPEDGWQRFPNEVPCFIAVTSPEAGAHIALSATVTDGAGRTASAEKEIVLLAPEPTMP
ncbi:MAG TPA: hypothetical protein VFG83_03000 [Kofleriaceae bacterium]|nr:hypothetical protein [Kofleriaceae bacterium]